ncbi:2-keto-4-pentenoate hydratase [Paracoccus aestuariivivens]|uniref:Hydratase n=1 Tax=Paracoccus aestuariivivens TaxID=1820333 RepID=A0A6L6J412_9RHOB|nr:hydratase [Paracoccus aestuariivivens]MTH76853.1 hydratase [Paracoccus aestuariivivens]
MPKPIRSAVSLAFLSLLASAGSAIADCPSDQVMADLAKNILTATPVTAPTVATPEDALCAQDKLVQILAQEWGAPSGYKAGLTSKPAQDAFQASGPVRGVLYADMMLESGAKLPAQFAALPRFESDLILVVADPAINEAKTPAEVLAHLSAIHPFIELPDLVVSDPKTLTPLSITAINVGARMGVLGDAIPVQGSDLSPDVLAQMQVSVSDESGQKLANAPGAAVLGNPLNAVLWLRDSGVRFKQGDLVSVGSFGPLLVPKAGQTVTVRYTGLPKDPTISVSFE